MFCWPRAFAVFFLEPECFFDEAAWVLDGFELPLAVLPLDEPADFGEVLRFVVLVVAALLAAGFGEVSPPESWRPPAIANVAHTSRIPTAAVGRAIRILGTNLNLWSPPVSSKNYP